MITTRAVRWAEDARQAVQQGGAEAFANLLTDDFVQESRRAVAFEFDRAGVLGAVDSMHEMELRVTGEVVAVASEHFLLTRRGYESAGGRTELLAITVWTDDGRIARMIEFDVDDLEAAISEMAERAGEVPIVVDG